MQEKYNNKRRIVQLYIDKILDFSNIIGSVARLLTYLNLAPSALRWREVEVEVEVVSLEKGHPEVLFLGLVTGMRWSKEERAFAVEAYVSNGRTEAHKQ